MIHAPEKVPDDFSEDLHWTDYVPEQLPCGGEHREYNDTYPMAEAFKT